jgi:hypothetical protein
VYAMTALGVTLHEITTGGGDGLLWTILVILAIIALVLFILGRR